MAIIIPETVFKNAFAIKMKRSTCKKEMQQCMQQRSDRLQLRGKIFFLQETMLPSLLLTNLTKSTFFVLFLPKYTKWILGEKKSLLMLLLSFNAQGFQHYFQIYLSHTLLPKGKQHFDTPHFIFILLPHLDRSW